MSFLTLLQVTILVAVEGEHRLSAISSSADLQLALQKLGSLPESSIQVCFFRNFSCSALSNYHLIFNSLYFPEDFFLQYVCLAWACMKH